MLEAGWPVGDLPYGALTVARKGGGRYHLHVDGVEAHAGAEFDRGASAILALAHKIEALHGLNGRWPGVTVNVGVVTGGATYNTVAGSAYADVDVRVGRWQDVPEVEAAFARSESAAMCLARRVASRAASRSADGAQPLVGHPCTSGCGRAWLPAGTSSRPAARLTPATLP